MSNLLKYRILLQFLLSALLLIFKLGATAQFPYNESFKNITAPGAVISGAAKLTAATGIDPVGQGYLRLTENVTNSVGYMYAQQAFPSSYGLSVNIEFFIWKPDNSIKADGLSFFLFDASVNAFRPGGLGGSLGYAQYYSTPGMAKGYLGLSIDEYGNYSNPSDGNKNGGPGRKAGSICLRGPGNGRTLTDYVFQNSITTTDPAYNIGFTTFAQRYPDASSVNYRRLKVILTPGSSLGASAGYTITAIMYKGGATVTAVTLISNLDYPFAAPPRLQYGLASSTGSISAYHEVRNVDIAVANASALLAPTVVGDNVTIVCQGQQALMDVVANDLSNNTTGSINKASVDLDPVITGKQLTFTDAGKGSYSADLNGIVTFTPVSGFVGNSSISYLVDDVYGITATTAGTISVTVNSATGPSLTVTDPAAVCSPQTIDITSSLLKSNTTAGASYDYFATLNNANSNTGNINATANAVNASGTYYIRANLDGCPTIKPVVTNVSAAATVAAAGANQTICIASGLASSTLLSNNPDVGTGTWSQLSGPTTATITLPNSSNCPIYNLDIGVYTFRWSISNGACAASNSNVVVTVLRTITSVAGNNQNLCGASSATLAANSASPGTGAWNLVSGPAVTFTTPASPGSTVTGLVPGNTYVLAWKTTNGSCTSTSQVTLTNNVAPAAVAGSDQAISNAVTATMQATAPATGNTGSWSLISGPAITITTPSSPVTTITGLTPGNVYTLRWTITNGTCSDSKDVVITNVLNTITNAGSDQTLGNVNSITLRGSTPDANNSGNWSIVSVPAGSSPVINNPASPSTTVSAITATGDYIFRWTITSGSFSNSDDVRVTVLSILPVRLLSFSGTRNNDEIVLNWKTVTEENNDHFNIERSADGVGFRLLATVSGAGSSNSQHEYSYRDQSGNISAPALFYRLAQVDRDGKQSLSPVIMIVLSQKNEFTAWPNPVTSKLHLRAYFDIGGEATINLYDDAGQRLASLRYAVQKGYNNIDIEKLQHIKSGLFMVEIIKDKNLYRQRLLKQ